MTSFGKRHCLHSLLLDLNPASIYLSAHVEGGSTCFVNVVWLRTLASGMTRTRGEAKCTEAQTWPNNAHRDNSREQPWSARPISKGMWRKLVSARWAGWGPCQNAVGTKLASQGPWGRLRGPGVWAEVSDSQGGCACSQGSATARVLVSTELGGGGTLSSEPQPWQLKGRRELGCLYLCESYTSMLLKLPLVEQESSSHIQRPGMETPGPCTRLQRLGRWMPGPSAAGGSPSCNIPSRYLIE